MEIIDPFSYRDKILMPKLVIDGTMDEFFLLDDSSYWWNQMPNACELNRFLMVPNAEHTQITGIFWTERRMLKLVLNVKYLLLLFF